MWRKPRAADVTISGSSSSSSSSNSGANSGNNSGSESVSSRTRSRTSTPLPPSGDAASDTLPPPPPRRSSRRKAKKATQPSEAATSATTSKKSTSSKASSSSSRRNKGQAKRKAVATSEWIEEDIDTADTADTGTTTATTADTATSSSSTRRSRQSGVSQRKRAKTQSFMAGLPFHQIFGAPLMQQRGGSSGIVAGLKSGDFLQKEHALDTLNTKFLMEPAEQWRSLPFEEIIDALDAIIKSMSPEDAHLASRAARAASSLLEARPQTASIVAKLGPAIMFRFQQMDMDFTEAGLACLKRLAREAPTEVLQLNAVPTVTMMIDFFMGASQKDAIELISSAADVCDASTFPQHMREAVSGLTQFLRMFAVRDPAVVEATCVLFFKLTRNLAASPEHVEALASDGLPAVFVQILQTKPLPIAREGLTAVLASLALMARSSTATAVALVQDDALLPMLKMALTDAKHRSRRAGSTRGADGTGAGTAGADEDVGVDDEGDDDDDVAVVEGGAEDTATGASAQQGQGQEDEKQENQGGAGIGMQLRANQLLHVVALIRHLLPPLPTTHPFHTFTRDVLPTDDEAVWEWRSGASTWRPYTTAATASIERAYATGAPSVTITVGSQTFVVDVQRMRQINLSSHGVREVRRTERPAPPPPSGDALHKHYAQHPAALSSMIVELIRPLFELYLASARTDIHAEFAHTLVRMVHAATPPTLVESLRSVSMSNYLAQMLHSREPVVVMGALATASCLLQRLPDIFAVHFRRKGVLHRVEQLCKMRVEVVAPTPATPGASTAAAEGGSTPSTPAAATAATPATPSDALSAPSPHAAMLSLQRRNTAAAREESRNMRRRARKQRMMQAKKVAYDFAREAFGDVLASTEADADIDAIISAVKAATSELRAATSPFDQDKASAALTKLSDLCSGNADGMTAFEFTHYGTAHALATFLTVEDDTTPHRLALFAHLFLVHDAAKLHALQRLLDLVHGALNLNENFESSGPTKQQFERRNFTVRVSRAADEKNLGSVDLNLSVPSTVTVQALYDYVDKHLKQARTGPDRLREAHRLLRRHTEAQRRRRQQQQQQEGGGGDDGGEGTRRRSSRRRGQQQPALGGADADAGGDGDEDTTGSDTTRTHARRLRRSARRHGARRGGSNGNDGGDEDAGLGSGDAASDLLSAIAATLRSRGRAPGNDEDNEDEDDDGDGDVNEDGLEAEEVLRYLLGGGGEDEEEEEADLEAQEEEGDEETPADAPQKVVVDDAGDDAEGGADADDDDGHGNAGDGGASTGSNASTRARLSRTSRSRASRLRHQRLARSDSGQSVLRISAGDDWWKVIAKGFRNKNALDLTLNGQVLPWNYSMIQAVRELTSASRPASRSGSRTPGVDASSTGGSDDMPTRVHVKYRKASARSRQVSVQSLRPDSRTGGAGIGGVGGGDADGAATTLDLPAAATSITQAEEVADLLRILRVLHILATDGVRWIGAYAAAAIAISPAAFINRRLAAKIMREVANTQALTSGTFPDWVTDAMSCCPFVLSYDQRVRFFRYTAFGCALGLRYLTGDAGEGDNQPLAQSKVQVSRKHLLASTAHIMHLYATHPTELSVSFVGEVGTGIGPTLEYYARTCEQFQRRDLNLWRDSSSSSSSSSNSSSSTTTTTTGSSGDGGDAVAKAEEADEEKKEKTKEEEKQTKQEEQQQVREGGDTSATAGDSSEHEFVFSPQGLYPKPVHALGEREGYIFELFGAFVAKAMQDNRPLDLNLSPAFYGWMVGAPPCTLADVRDVDEGLYKSLVKLQAAADAKKAVDNDTSLDAAARAEKLAAITVDGCPVEDLCLDFTLPGHPDVSLGQAGADTPVTLENLGEYVAAVVDFTLLRGVRDAMTSFTAGFAAVFDMRTLTLFTVEEVRTVVCGSRVESWDYDELRACIKAEHGYDSSSPQVQQLLEVLVELDVDNKRKFVQFLTGSPNLPVGGFKALKPPFTVVMKDAQGLSPDQVLPSVMTCQNYFKMPTYSSKDVLREKLLMAITEGQGSFDLS
ncbi:hypothetical protein PTSG_11742 [Salpingoeca rosetta]|uniref:E3 ubiquitin-protein ligase TRIP12 n=1 Tax=Salpingoeca rosetta (strain ATCC 50818 / BSB-021) TaxID=946362 RepID=F2U0G4_SALR5|nr:uncharacterized protein PTSG_11742 [Salpingoeca rosetta]EGD80892.1 hypothetical protein PTSG_11742 [Salpingoeca rosetta]|eukprot:XP_004997453.1 hypothetical protein PTSG_11742 [Salpingoeca rosetta]